MTEPFGLHLWLGASRHSSSLVSLDAMSAATLFVIVLLASIALITLMLLVVFLVEDKFRGKFRGIARFLPGSLFVLIGIRGLWWGCSALLHHTVLVTSRIGGLDTVWMSPRQAFAAFGLCFAIGVFLLVNATRTKAHE